MCAASGRNHSFGTFFALKDPLSQGFGASAPAKSISRRSVYPPCGHNWRSNFIGSLLDSNTLRFVRKTRFFLNRFPPKDYVLSSIHTRISLTPQWSVNWHPSPPSPTPYNKPTLHTLCVLVHVSFPQTTHLSKGRRRGRGSMGESSK